MGLPRLVWIRVKAALACLWALVGRAFCCFKRRRKLSNVGLPISVDVQSVPVAQQEEDTAVTWSWEDQPTSVVTVQDKIRAYRDSRARVSESEPAPEPDFFSDMAPTIRRSQKVLVAPQDEPQTAPGGFSSRLAYTDTALEPQGAELTDLEEPSAWEADDINPDALENHQRALRHQQLQQKRERRGAPPVR
ncbi:receptor-binding cancer antigen expressed on SiSo cells-like [Amphibalanus amphitrite]|uniref:receptor-binding cancer antigen expressed on SiSo cells-like n=1 Tax=Amphibalanus amphitrite TaxID=1232801 RepID=UPI001C906349|nr:receptor-binding cancer antigen expressed on SiSo cells-like [Amphibalanus amphitrite]